MLGRGHEVCIVAPPESRIFAEARGRGIPAHAAPIARKSPRGLWSLRRFFAERATDIVNGHSSTDSWLDALALCTLSRAPRLVRTRHISAPISRNTANRWLYRRASAHVVTTGERLREQVMRETGLGPERASSVPTGIDLERFAPGDRRSARARLGLPQDAFIVGIVATLRSWKGHRYLVDAVAQARDPRWRLVIVGDGPGKENLVAQIAALGAESQIGMPGNQDDVVPWLQALDVFALPSYANEGVPQAIMQAMACRIPIVTTPVGSIGEIVRDGHTGLFVQPQNADSLRAALARLDTEPASRERLAQAGYDEARSRFGAAIMLDKMERIFFAVAAGSA